MDVFRFARQPHRANDPTRRYTILPRDGQRSVGEVEIGGDAPAGETVVLSVACHPVLSDAAREDALGTARRFLEEMAAGWGRQVTELPDGTGWSEQPDGGFRIRLEYRAA